MSTSDDDVRVGTPERERAIGFLNDAFATGYLDVSEFEERSGVVYTARTRGELRPLVADLPNAAALFPDAPVASPTPVDGPHAPLVPVELTADWDTVRRKGSWQVPPRLLLTGTMGTVDLDFSKAGFTTPTVDVEVQVSSTNVKLRLGPDQEARVDDLVKSGWSSIKDKAGPPHRPGGTVFLIRGSLSAASGLILKR